MFRMLFAHVQTIIREPRPEVHAMQYPRSIRDFLLWSECALLLQDLLLLVLKLLVNLSTFAWLVAVCACLLVISHCSEDVAPIHLTYWQCWVLLELLNLKSVVVLSALLLTFKSVCYRSLILFIRGQ